MPMEWGLKNTSKHRGAEELPWLVIFCVLLHIVTCPQNKLCSQPLPQTLLYVFLPSPNFNLYPSPVMFHTVSIIAFSGVCKSFLLGNYQNEGGLGNLFPQTAVGIKSEGSLGDCASKPCSLANSGSISKPEGG